MVDFAEIAIKADSSDLKRAGAEMRKLGDQGDKTEKQLSKSSGRMSAGFASLAKNVGLVGVAFGALSSARVAISAASQLESALVGVSKTTGLAGRELDLFADRIGQISKEIPVSTAELLELAQAAGQMGVTGSANLEKFSITVAKLGRASDLAGEEAASALARILNVTGENIDSIDILSSVIVSLGNNVAATESQIARMTTELARSTSVFGVTSAEAAAIGAAMASIGVQAELGGSAVGRAMQTIANAVTGGSESLNQFADALNIDAQALTQLFQDDKIAAFELFLQSVGDLGLSAGSALKEVGLGGQEIAKTIIPLANNMDIFTKTLALSNAETANATALDREFEATLASLGTQWEITKNIALDFAKSVGEVVNPVITASLELFNKFFGAAEKSTAIQKQVALIEDLDQKLTSIKKHNQGLGGGLITDIFGTNDREIHELEASIEHATEDLFKMVNAESKLAEQVTETNVEIKEQSELIRNTPSAASGADKFISSLKSQQSELGKTTTELLEMRAAELGVTNQAQPLIDSIARINKGLSDEAVAADLAASRLRRVEEVTESVITPSERFAREMEELNDLLNQPNGITDETYSRAVKKLQDDFDGLGVSSRNTFDSMDQFSIQAARNIQTAFADFFFDPFDDGLKGLVKSFAAAIRRMVANAAALDFLKFSGLGNVFGSLGKSNSGSATLGIIQQAGGLLGGNGLSSLTGGIGSLASSAGEFLGIGALSSFGAGASGAASAGVFGAGGSAFLAGEGTALGAVGAAGEFGSAATLGAGFSSIAGPLAIAAAIDIGARLLAGDKTTGTFVDHIPVIGPLGSLFAGRGPLKQRETGLHGVFDTEGFSGAQVTRFKAQGGLLRGDKVDRVILDTDTGELLNDFNGVHESGISSKLQPFAEHARKQVLVLGDLLDDSITSVANSARQAADILGIGTAALDDFSFAVSIVTENGKMLDNAQVAQVIADASDAMIKKLMPNIDQLGKKGESVGQTFARLSAEVLALENAFVVMGDSVNEARDKVLGMSISARTDLVDSFGGVAALDAEVSKFFNNVLTDSQKLGVLEERIKDALAPIGIDFIPTIDQLYDAFKSGDAELVKLALQYDDLIVQANTLSESINDVGNTFDSLGESAENVVDPEELRARLEANRDLLAAAFGTDEEKDAVLRSKLSSRLEDLDVPVDTTVEQFEALARTHYEVIKSSDDLTKKVTGVKNLFDALADSAENSEAALIKDAFTVLSDAVAEERKSITNKFNTELDNVRTSISSVSDSVRELSSLSNALKRSSAGVFGLSLNAAQSQLGEVISKARSGDFPDIGSISNIVDRLTRVDPKNFDSREEFLAAQSKSVSLIDEMLGLSDSQLTIEEKSLNALENQEELLRINFNDEMLRLDGILTKAQGQIDALNGINTSVISVVTAIDRFNTTVSSPPTHAPVVPISIQRDSDDRRRGSNGNTEDTADLVNELRQANVALWEIQADTQLSAKVLRRISPDGDSINTKAVA